MPWRAVNFQSCPPLDAAGRQTPDLTGLQWATNPLQHEISDSGGRLLYFPAFFVGTSAKVTTDQTGRCGSRR